MKATGNGLSIWKDWLEHEYTEKDMGIKIGRKETSRIAQK
jgi:hypothetical protein